MIPALVAFDIDGTLTKSKQPITPGVAEVFSDLLSKTKVALTSGGQKELAQTQIIAHLAKDTHLENLYLLPTSGSALLVYEHGAWKTIYEELLSPEEVEKISHTLKQVVEKLGYVDFSSPSYGERIENRGSAVALSVLGQQAPLREKESWDPTREKRQHMLNALLPLLPEFEIKLGGLTTLDVTKKGVNKAYGIRKLSEYLSIPIFDMLYIGDALFPGGNDEVVKETEIKTEQTSGPEETTEIIKRLIY